MFESLISLVLSLGRPNSCQSPVTQQNSSLIKRIFSQSSDESIKVEHVSTVRADVIALHIKTGELIRGKQVPYIKHGGHVANEDGWIFCGGEPIGKLLPADDDTIWLVDRYRGKKLNTAWADKNHNYQVITKDNQRITPTAVHRKSKISTTVQTGQWDFEWPMEHTVYLQLPAPLTSGQTYNIRFTNDELKSTELVYRPENTRSDAVHVSHLGFHPNDPAKVSFLSTWMGDGKGLDYPENLSFWLINTATGEKVYAGKTVLSKAADAPEDTNNRNHNDTDVFLMDFSDFDQPGEYVVYVDSIGTSYSFEIGDNTWQDAFYVSARGMYHQRSGIELKAPYTDYHRPRPFHPDDGVTVYQSTVPHMDTSMSINYPISKPDAFESLKSTRTDEVLDNAWGGWMDAGDWDRRIEHLQVTHAFLELIDLYPEYFESIDLNLPESDNNLPDLMDEALWGLDVFRRLQADHGGVSGGIESAGHPLRFEGSWQESQTIMAYGPGIWSSYYYAGAAARAAYVLEKYDANRAKTYRETALRAMVWANNELAKDPEGRYPEIYDQRNLAAIELYRLTEDQKWHDLFLQTTVFTDASKDMLQWPDYNQQEAAFVYGRLPEEKVNPEVQKNAVAALVRKANREIEAIGQAGFRWNVEPYRYLGWGDLGTPKTHNLFRAHTLTGDKKYLEAGVLASQFSAGANPDNIVYTIGLGHESPNMPLLGDMRAVGQEPPPGITVYGPIDVQIKDGYTKNFGWALDMMNDVTHPIGREWPTTEAYFDNFYYVPTTEFTVHQSIGPTAYTWGYLAALHQAKKE
ncbi:MAG: glycoside hydrolase family 9 protein [Cyanobacteria bacterium P01_D01_bin.156]